ncbi:MAG: hypothetical protein HC921_15175 [Synechococcaceae cyanobacterium SM2_3_1]|nr:hypothetical protein [Synechococcaceae cyanobacterium SM2_3_1]
MADADDETPSSQPHEEDGPLELSRELEGRPPEKIGTVSVGESLPQRQERTRAYLAMGLLVSLGITIFFVGVVVWRGSLEDRPMSKELLVLIWTSQVTLASSALGFYFGTK